MKMHTLKFISDFFESKKIDRKYLKITQINFVTKSIFFKSSEVENFPTNMYNLWYILFKSFHKLS